MDGMWLGVQHSSLRSVLSSGCKGAMLVAVDCAPRLCIFGVPSFAGLVGKKGALVSMGDQLVFVGVLF